MPWQRYLCSRISVHTVTDPSRVVVRSCTLSKAVDIDWEKKTYSVTLDGAEVARDSSTFCPLGKDRIAMYSITDAPLVATLPSTWNTQDITAKALFADRAEPAKFDLNGRRVTVQMQSRRPVMIY
jgi:hypothetical protein